MSNKNVAIEPKIKGQNRRTLVGFEVFKNIVNSVNNDNLLSKLQLLNDRENKYLTIQETEWLLDRYRADLKNGVAPENSAYRTLFLLYMRKITHEIVEEFKSCLNYDYDMLMSLGMECVVNCVDHYDKSKVSTIYKYIYVAIKRKITDYIRQESKGINLYNGKAISLDEQAEDSDNINPEDIAYFYHEKHDQIKNDDKMLLADALTHLPPKHQFIVMKYYGLYSEPMTMVALAKELGKSHETIRQILLKSIQILRYVSGINTHQFFTINLERYQQKRYHVITESEFNTINSSKTLIEMIQK